MKESKFYNQISDLYPYLKNPSRYIGTRPIQMRSAWEIKFVTKFLDIHPSVISWGSESKVIRYFNPIKKRYARYFIDFNFTVKTSDGKIREYWAEIKPYKETIKPEIPKRKTKNYIYQVNTYIVNTAKWETTKALISEQQKMGKDIHFITITEKDCPFFLN